MDTPRQTLSTTKEKLGIELVNRAFEGLRVAVFSEDAAVLRALFRHGTKGLLQFAASIGVGVGVCPTHGQEIIRFSQTNGQVVFINMLEPGRVRGLSLDRVYVPADLTEEQEYEITPTLATTRDGKVVVYTLEDTP